MRGSGGGHRWLWILVTPPVTTNFSRKAVSSVDRYSVVPADPIPGLSPQPPLRLSDTNDGAYMHGSVKSGTATFEPAVEEMRNILDPAVVTVDR